MKGCPQIMKASPTVVSIGIAFPQYFNVKIRMLCDADAVEKTVIQRKFLKHIHSIQVNDTQEIER